MLLPVLKKKKKDTLMYVSTVLYPIGVSLMQNTGAACRSFLFAL